MPVPAKRLFLTLLLGSMLGGCAEFSAWDPMRRKEWAADERLGLTSYQRLEELRAVRRDAKKYTPEQREQLTRQLVHLLDTESNALLREAAVRTLGVMKTQRSFEALEKAAGDSDADVRVIACQALGDRGDDQAVAVLARLVGSDTDIDVRLAATRELARFRQPAAREALALALDDADPALRYRAVQSLKETSPVDYQNDIAAWREYAKGGTPPPASTPTMAQRIKDWF